MSVQQVIVGIVLAGTGLAAWPAPVGRVIVAGGITSAIRDGREIPLTYGAPIEAKDVLRTGAAGMLQVHFIDDSIKSLRENSELAIEEFRFAGSEDGTESAVFRLIKGGFRAATGLIGRTRHASYSVRHTTATIGIRGTDYAVRDCRGDCGAGVKDGLYGSVIGMSQGTNKIALSNNAGEFVFGINQHFHVIDANTAPQPLLQPPTFVAVRPQGNAKAVGQGGSGTGREAAAGGSGAEAESRPAAVTETLTQFVAGVGPVVAPYQVTMDLTQTAPIPTGNGFENVLLPPPAGATAPVENATGFSRAQLPPGGTITSEGLIQLSPAEVVLSVAVPHDMGAQTVAGSAVCQGLGCQHAATLNFDDKGLKFVDCGGDCFFDRNLALAIEVQSVRNVIEWGRWTGEGILASDASLNDKTFGQGSGPGGFHYIVGVPTSEMPLIGRAEFRLIGQTTPTFSDGFGGGLGSGMMTGGPLTVFFSGIIRGDLNLTFNGGTGSNYLLRIDDVGFTRGDPGVTGSGKFVFERGVNVCEAAGVCTVNFAGFFAGLKASHLGLGYNVLATAPETSSTSPSAFTINGVFVMKR